jgi:predicted O-methyltransferase YrrM
MEHFYDKIDSENWFTYPKLYAEMVARFPTGSHFVEVGTWKGTSACFMAVEIINSGKDIRFDCVDTWDFVEVETISSELYKDLYNVFLKNIAPVCNQITPVREISWQAAELYADRSLDFVFIDASHNYESVSKDISAWFPKLKKTGIIAGHDYMDYFPGVVRAVNEFFHEHVHKIRKQETCWLLDLAAI